MRAYFTFLGLPPKPLSRSHIESPKYSPASAPSTGSGVSRGSSTDAISTGLHGRSAPLLSESQQFGAFPTLQQPILTGLRLTSLPYSRRTSSVFRSLTQTTGSCSKHHQMAKDPTSCHNCQVTRATDSRKRISSTFAMTCAQVTFL